MLPLGHVWRKNYEFLLCYRARKHLAAEGFISNLPADSHKKALHQRPTWFLVATVFCGTLKQTEAQTLC